jgi:tetratricopeptide (TPR) repeat protein
MSPRPPETPHNRFETALRLAREGRFAEALAGAERELGEGGDRDREAAAAALAEVARAAQAAGDVESAARALDRAIALRPTHADLHYRRACVLLRLKRGSEARTALNRALEINPRYVAARIELAQLDAREGFLGEALGTLRDLSREAPLGESEDFRQGIGRLDRGEWEEAQAHFGRAVESYGDELRRRLQRTDALIEGEDFTRAITELHQAIAEHPAYPDLHAKLGRAELQQGYWDDAAASFGRALELNPSFHDARVGLATALEALGMRAQAVDQLALVLEREPAHAHARELHARWGGPQPRPAGAEAPRLKST